jgi:hypothetical protein
MKRYTIEQRASGTGSIHDISSEHGERVIEFRGATKYAVVLAAYYGGKGYTTHETEQSACRQAHKLSQQDYSYTIIDAEGVEYVSNGDRLVTA